MAESSHAPDAAPPEPSTPFWVTLLGATLLALGALYLLVPGEESVEESAAAEKTPAAEK